MAIGDTADGNSLISGNAGLAGTVALNFNLLDTSRANAPAGQYDLLSTVAHEVDEVLGIGGQGSTLAQGGTQPAATKLGALDLFRYSGVGTRTFTSTATGPAYFSINGGVTNLVNFNQTAGGDFADWGDGTTDGQGNTPPQTQDAFGGDAADASPNVGVNEFTALDVVGYTLVATPEPSTYAMMLAGLALLGFCIRRRRTVVSPRQRVILNLLLEGQSRKAIARHLAISLNTVQGYIRRIYSFFGVQSHAHLIRRFQQGNGGDQRP